MIWCLHGNISLAADWDILNQHESSSFKGQTIRKVDLWRYQECRSIGLEEFGEIFASEVAAQDDEPYLIGYSMGGRLALHALLAKPDLWKGVTLISAHPGLKTEKERVRRRASDAVWSTKALKMKWGAFLNEWNSQEVLNSVAKGLANRQLLQPRSQAIARAFNAWSLGNQKNHSEMVSKVSCPVKVITGERDYKYTELCKVFNFPDMETFVIKHAGHRTLWDNPEECFDSFP